MTREQALKRAGVALAQHANTFRYAEQADPQLKALADDVCAKDKEAAEILGVKDVFMSVIMSCAPVKGSSQKPTVPGQLLGCPGD